MPVDRFLHPRCGHSEKVTALKDLEYRVWTQYLLSADDFGVMRATAVKLQSDNDYLATKPATIVLRMLERLINVNLIRDFHHQGRRFVFQHDWQTWQKVEYPRATNEAKPPPERLAICDEPTRILFAEHPGGKGRKFGRRSENVSQTVPEPSEDVSQTVPEHLPITRAPASAKRLTANGLRPTAYGLEGGVEGITPVTPPLDVPLDVWFRELVASYPKQAVSAGYLTESAWCAVFTKDLRPAREVWAEMQANLANQMRGYQWRVKGMIPKLEKWLREGLWQQQHDEQPPVAEQLSPRTSRTLTAAANILREGS